jgi:amidophosphoribosyltransferase
MATRDELIAARQSVAGVRDHVRATSLHYLTLEGLQEATGLPRERFCRACFDGDYPIAVPEELAMCKMRFEGDGPCHPSAPDPRG